MLQEFLRDRSLSSGPVTGNFFSLTRESVKKFQIQEKISPAVGYFGTKTRVRANTILGVVGVSAAPAVPAKVIAPLSTVTRESILAQLQELQARVKALQEKVAAEQTVTISTSTTTALIFTKKSGVASRGFISDPPLGAHYPYRVTFDWDVNAVDPFEEFIYYSPILKTAKQFVRLRSTEYYPEPNTNYAVSVEVKDKSGSKAIGDFTFPTPSWVSVYGKDTKSFPAITTNPFKIGEFKVFNGTTTDVLFANFETLITEEMDSIPNRNKKVYFLLRDGATPTDPLISKTDFTFIFTVPEPGKPHKSPLFLPFDINLKPGEEKLVSLWVETLEYVKSGTLQIKSTKTVTTSSAVSVLGSFDFTLTKEPSAL